MLQRGPVLLDRVLCIYQIGARRQQKCLGIDNIKKQAQPCTIAASRYAHSLFSIGDISNTYKS